MDEKKAVHLQICVRQTFCHPDFGKEQVRQWMFDIADVQQAVAQFNKCYSDSYNCRTIEFVVSGEL